VVFRPLTWVVCEAKCMSFGIDRHGRDCASQGDWELSGKCSDQESMLVVFQQKSDTGGVPAIDL